MRQNHKENCTPVAKSETCGLFSRTAVGDVDALITVRIAVHGEGSGAVAQIGGKTRFGPEHEFAHGRMKTIGADDKVEASRWRAVELYGYSTLVLLEGPYAIAEHGFHMPFDSLVDVPGKIAASDAEKAIAQCTAEAIGAKTTNSPTQVIDDPHLARVVAGVLKPRDQVHSLGNVETHTPEIHDVAASAQDWSSLDHGRGEAIAREPIGESGASNARSGNQDCLIHQS